MNFDPLLSERLAIDGGPPLVTGGPPRWPPDDADVHAALESIYRDGAWGRYDGPHGAALAAVMRDQLNVPHVSLCCSGTIAVELALRGLRVEPGDEVLLAGYDFPGNFRAIAASGATPVLVDVVAGGVTIDPDQLEVACSDKTRAVVVSHLHANLAPMESIVAWAHAKGIKVVEDACQMPGATIGGRAAGTWGDAGVFSFGGSKLLTAGRGGAVVTSSAEVHQRIKIHCEQGNHAYPLSELQAAVLLPQWHKLPERHRRRRHSVERLLALLGETPGIRPLVSLSADADPAFYKLPLWHDDRQLGGPSRDEFAAAVEAEGVAIGSGFRGFAQRGARRCRRVGDLPHSRAAAEHLLLLHHPVLLEDEATLEQVALAIKKVASANSSPA